MNGREDGTLFDVSRQKWKQVVTLVLLVLLAADIIRGFLGLPEVNSAEGDAAGLVLTAVDIFIPVAFLAWFLFALRCPSCRRSIVWHLVRKAKLGQYGKLYRKSIDVGCPACGVKYRDLQKS